jgi:hypothetical protein
LAISVLDFNKEIEEQDSNPFLLSFHEPIFNILAYVNGKFKELTIKMSGEVECPSVKNLKDFDLESYRNYIIITEFLLGEHGQRIRESWGLSKEDFRELIFELYFALVREHATCNSFKKALLLFIGIWKFFIGRKLR